jgi:2-polyprenyl-6-methoxyphenol hydroxylase-like FAD-dependent oxidoreductase
VEGITNDERKQLMLELFREDQPLIRNIIGAAETTFPDFPSYALPMQPGWHKGPVVLAGDAVHAISPSSGQGGVDGAGGCGGPGKVPARHPGDGAGICDL